MKVLLKQDVELREERTIATIFVSESGGPVRQLITGREPHPTGRPVCVKAEFRAPPWESWQAELPFMELAEIASPIRRQMSQPHRLDMKVTGPRPVLTFFPDFELIADARFVDDLSQGTPFWRAALRWKSGTQPFDARKLFVEVKDDADPRLKDEEYLDKLDLARELYGKFGWSFGVVIKSRDLPTNDVARGVHKIWLRSLTRITAIDVAHVSDFIGGVGGLSTYAELAEKLGPGPLGRAKLAALHVRRVVLIDLMNGLTPHTAVSLLNDGGAII